MSGYGKFKSQRGMGPNHFMAQQQHEVPLPKSHMDRNQNTAFIRTVGPDKDDVVSIISQARSLLVDGRLNSSSSPYCNNYPG